jgi:CRP/FNR family cyclic AMP-dependent transcriptional regulator
VSGQLISREAARRVLDGRFAVMGTAAARQELWERGTLRSFVKDEVLMHQGDLGDFLHLIISGAVDIRIHDNSRVKQRGPGESIGEMATLEPEKPRSASCIAIEAVTVLEVQAAVWLDVASRDPGLWTWLCVGMAAKVREYTTQIRRANLWPRIFIGSAREQLPVARALEGRLKGPKLEVAVWDGLPRPGAIHLDQLREEARQADIALFVMACDDRTLARGQWGYKVRDNVVFELGLFMGVLGRDRALAVVEEHDRQWIQRHLPTDLAGLSFVSYRLPHWRRLLPGATGALEAALEPALRDIGAIVQELGPRQIGPFP